MTIFPVSRSLVTSRQSLFAPERSGTPGAMMRPVVSSHRCHRVVSGAGVTRARVIQRPAGETETTNDVGKFAGRRCRLEHMACSGKENACLCRPVHVRWNAGDELFGIGYKEKNEYHRICHAGQKADPPGGESGTGMPAIHQALEELAPHRQEIRSVAGSEVLPHLRAALPKGRAFSCWPWKGRAARSCRSSRPSRKMSIFGLCP